MILGEHGYGKGCEMKFEGSALFESVRRMLFLAAHTEGTAERLGRHELSHIVFKRVAEFQNELVEATEALLRAGQVRPAFASLRTLLELVTSFSWLAEAFDDRLDQFTTGRCPGVQKMMSPSNLGWEDEYRKTYSPLSDFVHGSFILSDFKKIEKSYDDARSAPYTALGDYFLVEAEGKRQLKLIEDRPLEELVAMHGGFIAAKTFDLVLTMLTRASGEYADAFNWWPGRKEVEAFDALVKNHWNDMHFLWLSEKRRLAIYRVEGRYA